MTILITILHIICCSLLIVVILIQGGRGQGLAGPSFTSGNVQSLFGTRAADFLTKATSVAAICFLLTCIALNWIETRKSKSLLSVNQSSRVDVDAIKKALEKVKSESAATTASTETAVEKTLAAAVAQANSETVTAEASVQQAAAEAKTAVESALPQTGAPATDATPAKN